MDLQQNRPFKSNQAGGHWFNVGFVATGLLVVAVAPNLLCSQPMGIGAKSFKDIDSFAVRGFQSETRTRIRNENRHRFDDETVVQESIEANEYLDEGLDSPEYEEFEEESVVPWRGYLKEKGPSRVIVEVEEEQTLQPLSRDIWDLIMGQAAPNPEQEVIVQRTSVTLDNEQVAIPKTTVETESVVLENKFVPEAGKIHREEADESPILDDASESYEQLMDLFSRPVFATPANDLDKPDGILSFRTPQEQPRALIREGSRARFEIRN